MWCKLEAVAMTVRDLLHCTLGWLKDAKVQNDSFPYDPSGGAEACWNTKCWLLNSNKAAASIRFSSWLIEWPHQNQDQ